MAKIVPALAKLSYPKLHRPIQRTRLFALLQERGHHSLLWITGPPGAGKTTLVATFLQARKLRAIWYQVDSGDADIATFFHYLGQAAGMAAPAKRTPLPLLTPEHLNDLPRFTRRFFRELFGRLPKPSVLVLDNYQEVAAESAFHNVVATAELTDNVFPCRNRSKENCLMKTNRHIAVLLACLFASLALPADAADRIRAGQWDTTLNMNGKTRTMSACIPQSEADAMNGDVKSIRAAVEKSTAETGCKVTDVKVNGGQVIVTSICAGKESVGTTLYRGDSAETENTNGVKALAKRVGACK